MFWGSELGSSGLHGKHLYPLSHLPQEGFLRLPPGGCRNGREVKSAYHVWVPGTQIRGILMSPLSSRGAYMHIWICTHTHTSALQSKDQPQEGQEPTSFISELPELSSLFSKYLLSIIQMADTVVGLGMPLVLQVDRNPVFMGLLLQWAIACNRWYSKSG